MSDTPQRLNTDDRQDNQKRAFPTLARFSGISGSSAIITSFAVLFLDLASGEYGGVRPIVLLCLGLPAGVFGMLGGMVWYRIRRKSKFVPVDMIALVLIGLVTGIIPFTCIKLLPQ